MKDMSTLCVNETALKHFAYTQFDSSIIHNYKFNIVFPTAIFKSEKLVKELNEKWEELFPITFEYVHESALLKEDITKKVRKFYLDNKPVSQATFKNISNVRTCP
jgi:hypothetical protein